MFLSLLRFFDDRKMRAVRYGELTVTFDVSDGSDFTAQYSIIFYANENGTREYLVNGSHLEYFNKTPYFTQCETWEHTGLFPDWAKDAMAEKLVK